MQVKSALLLFRFVAATLAIAATVDLVGTKGSGTAFQYELRLSKANCPHGLECVLSGDSFTIFDRGGFIGAARRTGWISSTLYMELGSADVMATGSQDVSFTYFGPEIRHPHGLGKHSTRIYAWPFTRNLCAVGGFHSA